MPLSIQSGALVTRMNAADPNTIADAFRILAIGTIMRQQVVALRRQSPNLAPVSPYNLATVQTIVLPDDAKARKVSRAYARAGGGTLGEMALTAYATPFIAPGAGAVGVTPAGDLAFLIADAYTDVDVEYEVAKIDPLELTLQAVPGTGVAAIPARYAGVLGSGLSVGVVSIMEAEVLVGTTVGKKVCFQAAAGAPAAGQARLDLAKANVQFAVADGAQSVRVKFGICSQVDVNALLEAASQVI
jgi:hypothetical protein